MEQDWGKNALSPSRKVGVLICYHSPVMLIIVLLLLTECLLFTECLLNARHLDNKCFMSIVPLVFFFKQPCEVGISNLSHFADEKTEDHQD